MGGKSGGGGTQVVGHKYYANLVVSIGNPIEDVLAINFDKRGAQYGILRTPIEFEGSQYGVTIKFGLGQLYGKDEGGVVGEVNFYFGTNDQWPDFKYAVHLESNGKYPVAYRGFMSYAVFHGTASSIDFNKNKKGDGSIGNWMNEAYKKISKKSGFYFGNSNTIRDMRYLVKRVNKRQDNRVQWYPERAEIFQIPEQVFIDDLAFSASLATTDGSAGITINSGFTADDVLLVTKPVGLTYKAWSAWSSDDNLLASGKPWSNRINVTSNGVSKEYWTDRFASKEEAELFASKKHFAITGSTEYKFWINDIPPTDNRGGVSLKVYKASGLTDINPVHAIRELFTDFRNLSIPESELNDVEFMRAADQVFEEGLGISYQFTDKNVKDALDEFCSHIDGGVRVNRQTGLYEIVLFRDDWFDLNTVQHFTKSSMNNIEIQAIGGGVDDVNTLNVMYNDRELDQDISFPIYNAAARHNAGRENPADVKFPYFKNKRNADLRAQWELKQVTQPAWQGSFTTSKYDARKLNRYDVIKISPGVHGISELPVRVMKIGLGDGSSSNSVSIEFKEVIFFSNDEYAITPVEPPIVVDTSPTQADFIVHEITYWEAVKRYGQKTIDAQLLEEPDTGYLGVSAVRPKQSVMSAALHTDAGGGYVEHATVFFCAAITLDQDIDRIETLFSVRDPQAFDTAVPNSIIRIGDELMLFIDYDEETELMRVKRGVSPTIPKPHLKDAVFYFVDNATYTDGVEYLDGEIVNAKLQSITASSTQDLDSAQVKSLEIVGLANRPYPPANVKINGEYWPEEIETDLIVTWVDRNRIQQTGGETLGWFEAGVTIEPNTTTQLTLTQFDETQVELETVSVNVSAAGTYTYPMSAMEADTRTIQIVLKTVRDGFECAEPYVHTVELSQFFSAPYNLTVEYVE